MNKLIVCDVGYFMHRSIFAYIANPQLPPTFTFSKMLLACMRKIGVDIEDNIIMAQDFGSWRKAVDPCYKAQRKDFRESKMDAEGWKEIYKDFNDYFIKLDIALPWKFVKIYHMESDDIAAVCSKIFIDKEIILMTNDQDWELLTYYPNVKIFSPTKKQYKIVTDPMKILLKKINGDISDNLLTKPSTEAEFERRKKIVDLIQLPFEIEQPIKEILLNLPIKNMNLNKIPFRTIREEIKKLYNL
jgi:hypothetical protein